MKRNIHNLKNLAVIVCSLLFTMGAYAAPLTFDSGSNGSDGALDFNWVLSLPAAERTIVFDPKDDATFDPESGRELDPDNDNVFHFTSILIPSSVTVVLRADKLLWRPVYWLATEDITIQSSAYLYLNGANGHIATSQGDVRVPAMPGPGGFPGGLGANSVAKATAGFGPGAGLPAATDGDGGDASHATLGSNNSGGTAGPLYGTPYLVPLVGGSGGAGGGNSTQTQVTSRSGGGAGGGAIVLASRTKIVNDGQIWADGGYGAGSSNVTGGGIGSGGSVRLMAPIIMGRVYHSNSGSGSILVRGGRSNTSKANGRIRVEAFNNQLQNSFFPDNTEVVRISGLVPTTPFLPTDSRVPGWPSVRVVSVDGVLLPSIPTASFSIPDAQINSATDVPIVFATINISTTASLSLQIISPDNDVIVVTPTHTSGTPENSMWNALVTFPAGFSRGYVQASWVP